LLVLQVAVVVCSIVSLIPATSSVTCPSGTRVFVFRIYSCHCHGGCFVWLFMQAALPSKYRSGAQQDVYEFKTFLVEVLEAAAKQDCGS
jgi:hypothetical protein